MKFKSQVVLGRNTGRYGTSFDCVINYYHCEQENAQIGQFVGNCNSISKMDETGEMSPMVSYSLDRGQMVCGGHTYLFERRMIDHLQGCEPAAFGFKTNLPDKRTLLISKQMFQLTDENQRSSFMEHHLIAEPKKHLFSVPKQTYCESITDYNGNVYTMYEGLFVGNKMLGIYRNNELWCTAIQMKSSLEQSIMEQKSSAIYEPSTKLLYHYNISIKDNDFNESLMFLISYFHMGTVEIDHALSAYSNDGLTDQWMEFSKQY